MQSITNEVYSLKILTIDVISYVTFLLLADVYLVWQIKT